MTDWTGHRQESFQFELLDLDDQLVAPLTNVAAGGQLEFSTAATIRGSGSITIRNPGPDPTDWARSRVRVSYVLDGDAVPLITAIPRAPVESHKATGTSLDIELYDKTLILREDSYGASWALPAGSNIIDAVAAVISSTGVPARDLLLVASADTASTAMVWEAGTSKLAIVNDLLDSAGYFAIYCDGWGRFHADPYTTPTQRGTSWSFADDETGVYLPEWTLDADVFTVPNRYICVASTEGETPALTATATDIDPASPYSFGARGRWITRVDTDVDASSQATLELLAERRLHKAQQVGAVVELTHPWLPFGLNHVVTFTDTSQPAPLRAVCWKQVVRLSTGGLVTSSLRRLV